MRILIAALCLALPLFLLTCEENDGSPTSPPTIVPDTTAPDTTVPDTTVPDSAASDSVPFGITRIEYDTSIIADGDTGNLIIHWEGEPVFPVTAIYRLLPDGCPSGVSCVDPSRDFAEEANPLLFENAVWCTGATDSIYFDYEVLLVDADGDSTEPVSGGFSCLPDFPLPRRADTTAALTSSLTGTWQTTYGAMLVTQRGDSVHGIYDTDNARIAGALKGHRLDFSWWEPAEPWTTYERTATSARGDGLFRVVGSAEDTMVGRWRYEGDGEWESSLWWAYKVSDTLDSSVISWLPLDDTSGADTATTDPTEVGWYVSGDSTSELLFLVNGDDGSSVFVSGVDSNGTLVPTHLVYRDIDGRLTAVMLYRFHPVQWILDTMTIATYPPSGEPFDPHAALHYVAREEAMDTVRVDMYPRNPSALVDTFTERSGSDLSVIGNYLAASSVSDFADLRSLASMGGENRQRHIFAAVTIGLAASALALDQAAENGLSKPAAPVIAQGLFRYLITMTASMLANAIGDQIAPGLLAGDGPTVGVLLCQGAAKYGICHYMFYRKSELNLCVKYCLTSMRCFTNICMPTDVSVETAMNLRAKRFAR